MKKEILEQTELRIARLSAELRGLQESKRLLENQIFDDALCYLFNVEYRIWNVDKPMFVRVRYSDGVQLAMVIAWKDGCLWLVRKNPSGWSKSVIFEDRLEVVENRMYLCNEDEEIPNRKQAERLIFNYRFDSRKCKLVRKQSKTKKGDR